MASHGLTNRSPSKFRHTTSDESVVKRQISHPIGRDVTQCLICETTHSCKHTRLVMVISEECRSNDKRKNKPTCQPTIETWQKERREQEKNVVGFRLLFIGGLSFWFDIVQCLLANIVLALGISVVSFEFEKLGENGLHLLGWQLQCDAALQNLPTTNCTINRH